MLLLPLLTYCQGIAQYVERESNAYSGKMPKPRNGRFNEHPGSYVVTIRLPTPVIDPGDTLKFDLFFSGCGEIEVAKLFCRPSDEIFNPSSSTDYTDVKRENGVLSWGATEQKFPIDGVLVQLSGGPKSPTGIPRP